MNPFRWSFRAQCAAGFFVCAALYAYAIFVQFALGIEPCPLCIFQRIVFIVMAILFLVSAIQNPQARGRRVMHCCWCSPPASGSVSRRGICGCSTSRLI